MWKSGHVSSGSRAPRVTAAVGAVAAFGALVVGVLLIVAPLHLRGTTILAGLGIVVVGIAVAQRPNGERLTLARVTGGLLLALGAVIAIWPTSGAPLLATLIGVAVIVHALYSAYVAVRGNADQRVTAIIAAVAGVLFGVLTFTWPVLTITVFRYAVGAWLIFLGLKHFVEFFRRPRDTRVSRWRRWSRTIGASLSLVLAVAFAWGSGAVLGGTPLPSPGAFYTPPEDVPSAPGQLIRSDPLTTGVPKGADAWRILYTTTHPDGSPAVSSGTVIAPQDRGTEALPLLSVAHGTTGVVAGCAPSLSVTPFADGAGTALAEMVTKHGWVAVTSDYVGLGTGGTHPYLIGEAEARNVLDASRAVQHFSEIATTTETVVWGHSQGGQGSLWTGQIADDYAPELSVEGIAAFAPAADLYGLAVADKDDAPGKTVSAYIAGTWDKIFPELQLKKHLTPGSTRSVEKVTNLCFNGEDALAAILRGTQVPNQVFPDSLLEGEFGDKLKAQTPEGPFPAPVLVAQGLADPLVKPALQNDWVEARCKAGVAVDYRTFPGLDHTSLVDADSPLTPEIVEWTLDRWDGKAATPNCDDLPDSTADSPTQ